LTELPHLRDMTLAAFESAVAHLQCFPAVYSHGDFHPYNVCPGAVIDLDSAGRGYAGYDVISGLLMDDLFSPDDQDFQYSDSQRQRYLDKNDAIFAAYGLPSLHTMLTIFSSANTCHSCLGATIAHNNNAGSMKVIQAD